MSVQPGRLAGLMAISPLLDAARPALKTKHVIRRNPAARARGLNQAVGVPCGRPFGMLQDAAPCADSGQRGLETPAVVAFFQPGERRRRASPVSPPPFAGRMRHDRVGAGIEPGVPRLVPRLDMRQAVIATVSLHVEGGDHHSLFRHTAKMTPAAANEARETASMTREDSRSIRYSFISAHPLGIESVRPKPKPRGWTKWQSKQFVELCVKSDVFLSFISLNYGKLNHTSAIQTKKGIHYYFTTKLLVSGQTLGILILQRFQIFLSLIRSFLGIVQSTNPTRSAIGAFFTADFDAALDRGHGCPVGVVATEHVEYFVIIQGIPKTSYDTEKFRLCSQANKCPGNFDHDFRSHVFAKFLGGHSGLLGAQTAPSSR